MQQRLTASVLILSLTILVGCAPKLANQSKSTNPLAVSNWKMPSWSWPSWTKKSGKKSTTINIEQIVSTRNTPARTFASKEPSAAKKFSNSVKDSAFGKGLKSAWTKTTTTLAASPISKIPEKMKAAFPEKPKSAGSSTDPVLLASDSPKPNAHMHTSMARLLESSGQTAKAEEHYRQALAIDAKNLDALLGHAHLLDRQGQLDRAGVLYQMATVHHPNNATAFNDLGLCLARRNRLSNSIQALDRAVQLQPQRKLYRNNLATVLTELKRNDEAFAHLAAVHGVAVAHYNMGFLLNKKGETQTAVYHFSEAARADPNFVSAQRWADHLIAARPAAPNSNQLGTTRPQPTITNVAHPNANPLR